jgi:uncharacterized protein (TIGR02145 family)
MNSTKLLIMTKALLFLSVIGLLITSCEKNNDKIVDSDGNEYKTVTNPTTGKTWLDRNLGASQVATSSTDSLAYGDLYQWGRESDGHQHRNSSTTSALSNIDNPNHSNFITSNSVHLDWRSTQNDNLWQGVNGTNNSCPDGYRLPTKEELEEEIATWVSDDADGAFASPLKLTLSGTRAPGNGSIYNVNSGGRYWSSSINGIYSYSLYFYSSNANISNYNRAYGASIRCIKD